MSDNEIDYIVKAAVVVIQDKSKFRKRDNETDLRFLKRVCDHVQRWPDDRWRELGDDIQKIINVMAVKKSKTLGKTASNSTGTRGAPAGVSRSKDRGIKRYIKLLILDDPMLTADQIYDIATKQDPNISINTVAQIRGELVHTLRLFLKQGDILNQRYQKRLVSTGIYKVRTKGNMV